MSRCICCDARLNDWEMRRKNQRGEFLDTCSACLRVISNYDKPLADTSVDEDPLEDDDAL